jgi:hypothetical protein
MIYLFKKRNGQIMGNTAASASAMFRTPNNFVTFIPEYLGAVQDKEFTQTSVQSEIDVPMEVETIIMKDGQPTTMKLDRFQMQDLMKAGDKGMEARIADIQERRAKRHQELLADLALTADKTAIPPDYSHRLAGVTDAIGDTSHITKTFRYESA